MKTSKSAACSLKEQVEMLGEYLIQHYEFRRNVLSNCYEVRELNDNNSQFRPLTPETFNTISRRIKCEGLEISNLKQNLEEYIYSEETRSFCPVKSFLDTLPAWDGYNHIGDLFNRIPGITTDQQYFLAIWLRSVVAHWLGMDTLHGNECVVTLIGDQGCGKSTFCACILPIELRQYYLDHLNLSNKFDKEMALSNNLLVNIDELDQIKPGQHAQLKQTLSKHTVNGRPIYGREQKNRRRYASFVATTNNVRPLTDPTGSRRYLCIQIPNGALINNDTEVNYVQLYAQVVHELKEQKLRYWFTNEEVKRIEALNLDFQAIHDLESMVDYCFRAPMADEEVAPVLTTDIVKHISRQFPNVEVSTGNNVKVGRILKQKNFQCKNITQGHAYYVVPRKTA